MLGRGGGLQLAQAMCMAQCIQHSQDEVSELLSTGCIRGGKRLAERTLNTVPQVLHLKDFAYSRRYRQLQSLHISRKVRYTCTFNCRCSFACIPCSHRDLDTAT